MTEHISRKRPSAPPAPPTPPPERRPRLPAPPPAPPPTLLRPVALFPSPSRSTGRPPARPKTTPPKPAASKTAPPVPTPAARARAAGLVVDGRISLPTMWSWPEFVDRATAPPTTTRGHSRLDDGDGWAGASWDEAVRLATDGWTRHVPEIDVAVTDLRSRMSDAAPATTLAQVADTAGSEVDVAAYLAGVPECMLETEIRHLSTHGRVVTFMLPASYSSHADHASIINRGTALCALCTAIVESGHSVEVWSGFTSRCATLDARCTALARVISAGEPFDPFRLMFAVAHPAMLRRLWFGVWDSADAVIADAMPDASYGSPPYACPRGDLPDEVADAYVFSYLDAGDERWADPDDARRWSMSTFVELGLLTGGLTPPDPAR